MYAHVVILLAFLGTCSTQGVSFPTRNADFLNNGNTCSTKEGLSGTCKGIYSCPTSLNNLRQGIYPSFCPGNGFLSLIVCCPLASAALATDYLNQFQENCGSLIASTALRSYLRNRTPSNRNDLFRRKPLQYVVGGENARKNAWPWMVLIGNKPQGSGQFQWTCGGVLITDRHVLTAAHCLTPRAPTVVRLREHDLSTNAESQHQDVSVFRVIPHPQFQTPSTYNDIAILQLSTRVKLNEYVQVACLPTPNITPATVGKRGVVTGWGTTHFGGPTSNILQQVAIPIVEKNNCQTSYQELRHFKQLFPRGLSTNQLCAAEKGKDACQGDSGGPFMVYEEGRYRVMGVISAGQGCAAENYPGIYTWVYPYIEWIRRTVAS